MTDNKKAYTVYSDSAESKFDETTNNSDDEEYEVERIVTHRLRDAPAHPSEKDYLLYDLLTKWTGYGDESNTWEPMESLMGSVASMVEDYFESHGQVVEELMDSGKAYYKVLDLGSTVHENDSVEAPSMGGASTKSSSSVPNNTNRLPSLPGAPSLRAQMHSQRVDELHALSKSGFWNFVATQSKQPEDEIIDLVSQDAAQPGPPQPIMQQPEKKEIGYEDLMAGLPSTQKEKVKQQGHLLRGKPCTHLKQKLKAKSLKELESLRSRNLEQRPRDKKEQRTQRRKDKTLGKFIRRKLNQVAMISTSIQQDINDQRQELNTLRDELDAKFKAQDQRQKIQEAKLDQLLMLLQQRSAR